jgi:hypothetical protein
MRILRAEGGGRKSRDRAERHVRGGFPNMEEAQSFLGVFYESRMIYRFLTFAVNIAQPLAWVR